VWFWGEIFSIRIGMLLARLVPVNTFAYGWGDACCTPIHTEIHRHYFR
jgi:hypothetical protein